MAKSKATTKATSSITNSALAVYLANQIFQGRLDYDTVIKKYPRYKDIIDQTLAELSIIPMSVDEEVKPQ